MLEVLKRPLRRVGGTKTVQKFAIEKNNFSITEGTKSSITQIHDYAYKLPSSCAAQQYSTPRKFQIWHFSTQRSKRLDSLATHPEADSDPYDGPSADHSLRTATSPFAVRSPCAKCVHDSRQVELHDYGGAANTRAIDVEFAGTNIDQLSSGLRIKGGCRAKLSISGDLHSRRQRVMAILAAPIYHELSCLASAGGEVASTATQLQASFL